MAKKGKGRGRPAGARGASGKGELLGKRIWKKYPNHYLVGGGAVGVGALIYAQMQGWIPEIIPLDMLGLGSKTPWSITTPIVQPGQPAQVQGKAKSQVYYTVQNAQGQVVGQGVLGGPGDVVGSIPTTGLASEMDYSVTLSDTPTAGTPTPGKTGTGLQMTTISPIEGGQPNPQFSPAGGITTNQAGGFQQTQGGPNLTLSRFGAVVPLGSV